MADFNGYAPPLIYGPWFDLCNLGGAFSLRVDVYPAGDTTLFGELRYFNKENIETTQEFESGLIVSTSNSFQTVRLRVKGVPLGSAFDGKWITATL